MVVLTNQIFLLYKLAATLILFIVDAPGQFTEIFTCELTQHLGLLLEALVADERLLDCVAGHTPHVLTNAIRNQVIVLTVEGGAVGCGLITIRHTH